MNIQNLKFGFDLDNTLIDYSKAVERYCKKQNLCTYSNIKLLKDALKASDTSDNKWRSAQGWIYSHGLQYAELTTGSVQLFEFLISKGFTLYIVSHKSLLSFNEEKKFLLREYAVNWIKKSELRRFFCDTDQIYFEETLNLKINRIAKLKLNYFVDDLEKVFTHKKFPKDTKRILLSANSVLNKQFIVANSFNCIREIVEYAHK